MNGIALMRGAIHAVCCAIACPMGKKNPLKIQWTFKIWCPGRDSNTNEVTR